MTNEAQTQVPEGTDSQESSPSYAWIVAQLSPRWRVVESRDGLQWIIQYSRLNKGATRWYGHYHLRSQACLLRYVGELEGQGEFATDPATLATLASLPAWVETRGGETPSKVREGKTKVAAA